jgi:multidrug transporter EmrE-like cation transporter
MPYIYLIIAISTEVIGSAFLKSSKAFQNLYHPFLE